VRLGHIQSFPIGGEGTPKDPPKSDHLKAVVEQIQSWSASFDSFFRGFQDKRIVFELPTADVVDKQGTWYRTGGMLKRFSQHNHALPVRYRTST
jgi:hypothetical protein